MDQPERNRLSMHILQRHLALLDGKLSEAEMKQFSDLLESSAEARRIYIEHAQVTASLICMYRREA